MAKERKQHLFFVKTPPTRQDRMGVDLQEETETDLWMDGWMDDGWLVGVGRRPDGKKDVSLNDRKVRESVSAL